MPSTLTPKVYSPREWWQRFLNEAKTAKKSIYLQSLTFEAGEMLDPVVPVLCAAAQRGVQVRLHIDWVAQFYVHGHIKFLPRLNFRDRAYAEEIWQRNRQHVASLRQAGVEVVFTNKFMWWQVGIKIAGRNHQKIYVVDEEIAWMGGVNLLDKNLQALDLMVEFHDPTRVQAIVKAFWAIDQHRLPQDLVERFSSHDQLLVDRGARGQSAIYDAALNLVTSAKREIQFISQFIPEGQLRKLLLQKARDGVRVTVFTSALQDRKYHTLPYRPVYQKFLLDTRGIKSFEFLHLPQAVHAKVLLVDGREVIVGSHNLVEMGVNLGTQEIAYHSSELTFVQWFVAWFAQVGQS